MRRTVANINPKIINFDVVDLVGITLKSYKFLLTLSVVVLRSFVLFVQKRQVSNDYMYMKRRREHMLILQIILQGDNANYKNCI